MEVRVNVPCNGRQKRTFAARHEFSMNPDILLKAYVCKSSANIKSLLELCECCSNLVVCDQRAIFIIEKSFILFIIYISRDSPYLLLKSCGGNS